MAFSSAPDNLTQVEVLRQEIAHLFLTGNTTLDHPYQGCVRFRGHFLRDPIDCFDELRLIFEKHGFTPHIRQGAYQTSLLGIPVVFEKQPTRWGWSLVLFFLTVLSTLHLGASYTLGELPTFSQIWLGWPYSLSLMLILTAHEFGHYFAARYHNVSVTLPYFIPMPGALSIIGTLGAFIRLQEPIKNRRALHDIGVAGPLAGMVFAIPILIYGLATSELTSYPVAGSLSEGNSILYVFLKWLVFGEILPGNGLDVALNQVAWAGWVGLLVTSFNLMPIGQLDGGHVAYVLFGERAKQFFWPMILVLATCIVLFQATTWIVWTTMLFFFARTFAEPLDDVTPLDPTRKRIAYFTFALFFLIFMPNPLQFIQ